MGNEMRTGTDWETMLKKYHLRGIRDAEDGDGWTIDSVSGNHYRVTRRVSRNPEASDFYWHCNCPARKRCRHIDAVEQMLHAEAHAAIAAGDYDAIDDMEMLERTK